MALLDLQVAHPLRGFDLDLALQLGAETMALVGPSGAGKTSLLRVIAGLMRPRAGRVVADDVVWFDAERRVDVPAERRRVGLVFQDYALFPHMTVRENVAFGGPQRADALLERLRIEHLAADRPGRLSGGERQRVALARALARDPQVLLLDEPLAALDASTRGVVRGELSDILRELALPTLLVTHDWDDAAQLADRAGVLVAGQLRQLASTATLAEAPQDAFVAQFTGANVLHGEAADGVLTVDRGGRLPIAPEASGRVSVALAPWHIELHVEPPAGGAGIPVRIASVTPEHGRVRVRTDRLTADVDAADGLARDAIAWALAAPEHVSVLRAPA